MNDFLLKFSVPKLKATIFQTRDLNIIKEVLPGLMSYLIHAEETSNGGIEVRNVSDIELRKASGLSTLKWRKAKAFMKSNGWVSYEYDRYDNGQVSMRVVKIHSEFVSIYNPATQSL